MKRKKRVIICIGHSNETPYWAFCPTMGATKLHKTEASLHFSLNFIYGKGKWEVVDRRLANSSSDIPDSAEERLRGRLDRQPYKRLKKSFQS